MDTIVAMLTAKKDHEDEVSGILHALVRDTAREPGAVDYQLHRGEAGTFVVYERYRDQDALDAHLKSEHLSSALKKVESLLLKPPEILRCSRTAGILPRTFELEGRAIEVHVLPLGPANLVFARTQTGVLGCGAIDPAPLQRLGIAAARARPTRGTSIGGLDDLLVSEVREVNDGARARGVEPGMSGSEALRRI